MIKRWVIKKSGDDAVVQQLTSKLKVDNCIANLLIQKGITNLEQAHAFFHPNMNDLHDPFLMKDMDKAISRIESAINNQEKILVYGDYDVDGTTAVALVFSFFKNFYSNINYYIPDRFSEGYGVSVKGIDYAVANNFQLIISVDCGTRATKQVQYALSKNIDFIICDHHHSDTELPPAVAILNPKQRDCNYPYNELSGCGIGFKLIQAFAQKNNFAFAEVEQYLDLVAISIASDIVEITGENRILTYYGLHRINMMPRPGIEAILIYSGIKRKSISSMNDNNTVFSRKLNVNDLVFLIGPRLNASGRVEHGKSTVELLVCNDIECANIIGQNININNTERRNFDTATVQQALQMIYEDKKTMNAKTTVVFNPDWHKGVVGIVASRLTETFYRPTIVLTQSNELITGSARSVKDFNVYDAINACSDLLEHFGGHKYAAGLSLKPENLIRFKERFEEIVSSTISERMLTPEIDIDMELTFPEITTHFFNVLKQFAPFGPGNLSPVFIINGVIDTGFARLVGKNHLKLCLRYPVNSSQSFQAIAFHQAKYLPIIKNTPFDICCHIEENEWNGSVYLQLNIKDIKIV